MDQLVTHAFRFQYFLSAGSAIKPAHSDVDCLNENELAEAKEVVMAMDVVARAASLLASKVSLSYCAVKHLRLMTYNVPQNKY